MENWYQYRKNSRSARRGTSWVIKFGYLCIQENLVITWPYVRPSTRRPSAQRHRVTNVKCHFQASVQACNLRLIWIQSFMLSLIGSCQNRVSTDQYRMTVSCAQIHLVQVFFRVFDFHWFKWIFWFFKKTKMCFLFLFLVVLSQSYKPREINPRK